MWGVAALSSIPSPAFCPTPSSTTTKSPRAHAPFTVSANPQNKNYNHEDGLPQSVLKSNTPISKNPKQLNGEDVDSDVSWKSQGDNNEDMGGGVVNSGNPKEPSDSEGKSVGGSDILWALLKVKASAKKNNNNSKAVKKREIPASKIKDGNTKEEDYRNVKPLRIRSDWSSRLDDLERRLKELIDS